jgi:itaconate CoA-transferase
MYAYTNILSALMLREKTGVGSSIDVSMLEALSEWMGYPLYYAYQGASPPPRSAASHATIYPYGPFPAGDQKTVMLGLQNEREWQVFCEQVLVQPELAKDPRFDSNFKRNENRQALEAIIIKTFASMTAAKVVARLESAQIAHAQVNDMHDLLNHAQLKARKRWVNVDTPAGPVPALLPPGNNAAFSYRMDPIPAVGEHTDAIMRELGLQP